MSKFLFFLATFLWAVEFPYTFSLKKDEVLMFNFRWDWRNYIFKMRWTLYKNDILTVLYRYDNYPHQVSLYSEYPLNTFRFWVVDYTHYNKIPYFLVEFVDFKDNQATFTIHLLNDKNDGLRVDDMKKGYDVF
ncbi:MAG: hypothetical protein GXO62_00310 [Epsilonproteobacteria bacterium]|nr:hypothetical protein [Campylobacterota bacterium]